ncbi:GET complex subunit get1 [Xenoophorus captivus]|uniref:Guided entry of tail-anchored proteins factor 1 n=1 Tax=Xenoophorus captivus TaxID=1517983 RepID=A0ABV0RU61_9TELE
MMILKEKAGRLGSDAHHLNSEHRQRLTSQQYRRRTRRKHATCLRCNINANEHKLSKMVQKDAEQESEMRTEIQQMKKEQSSISMMDEFARYARLERKINKTTDKLKTHVQSRTAQQAKMKWVVNIVFYILQAILMVSLIWKYYSDPVTVVPSKWIAPVERLVVFPTGVAGGVGITCWLVVCNKVITLGLNAFS